MYEPQPIASFDYFVGKVCSIHTVPTNWKLEKDRVIDYFVGIVDSVNECGVCLTNVIDHHKTFIMTPFIVAIAEESVGVGGRSEHEKSVREYEEKKSEIFGNNPKVMGTKEVPKSKPITKINDSPFADLDSMTAHIRAAKEKFHDA